MGETSEMSKRLGDWFMRDDEENQKWVAWLNSTKEGDGITAHAVIWEA